MFNQHTDAIAKARAAQDAARDQARSKAAAERKAKDDAEFDKAKRPPTKTAKVETKVASTKAGGRQVAKLPSGKRVAVSSGDLRKPTPAAAPTDESRPGWMDYSVIDPAWLKATKHVDETPVEPEEYLSQLIEAGIEHALPDSLITLVGATKPKENQGCIELVDQLIPTDQFNRTANQNEVAFRAMVPKAKHRAAMREWFLKLLKTIRAEVTAVATDKAKEEFYSITMFESLIHHEVDTSITTEDEIADAIDALSPIDRACFLRRYLKDPK